MILYSMALLGLLNLGTLVLMAWDKRQAKLNKQRIAERTFWGWSAVGGSLGVVAGMWLWQHKTQKPSFYGGIYLILLVQVVLLFLLWR